LAVSAVYKNITRVRLSRLKVKGQGHWGPKKRKTAESSPLTMHNKACSVRCTLCIQQQLIP